MNVVELKISKRISKHYLLKGRQMPLQTAAVGLTVLRIDILGSFDSLWGFDQLAWNWRIQVSTCIFKAYLNLQDFLNLFWKRAPISCLKVIEQEKGLKKVKTISNKSGQKFENRGGNESC